MRTRPDFLPRRIRRPGMFAGGDGSTLSLDFTSMSGLDTRFTYTRNSIATFINSRGLVEQVSAAATNDPTKARFDYDPTTLAPKGLLIEGSVTNLLNWSESFSTSGGATNWGYNTNTGAVVSTSNPAGGSTAFQFAETANAGPLQQSVTATNAVHTFSAWFKGSTYSGVTTTQVQFGFFVTAFVAGTPTKISGPGSVSVAGNIVTLSGLSTSEWTRVQLTTTSALAAGAVAILIYPNSTSFQTNASFYIWGAQIEAGSGASSYIPTGSGAVQRAADLCQMTGTNFSSWFGSPTSATVYAEAFANVIPPASNFPGVWLMNKSGNARNYGFVRHTNGALRVAGFNAATGGTIVDIETLTPALTTVTAGTRFKHAVAMSDLNWAYAANAGSGVNTATNTTVYFDETVDSLTIGLAPGQLGSHTIAKLKYWPIALPTATLQALTA